MPTSKTYLPDINVWIAMAFEGHVHHQAAVQWFNEVEETVAFCRVTQMGFLRLLTNPKVMGKEVLSQTHAWGDYDKFHRDYRITFLNEPSELEDVWRSITQNKIPDTNAWTDAYLLAFAKARDLTFVSFDQSLKTFIDIPIIILGN